MPIELKRFSSLPNEILEAVLLEDVLTRSDLCSLALVNRSFSHLMRVSLYDTIECRLVDARAINNLMCTLRCHPELSVLVRSIYMYLDESKVEEGHHTQLLYQRAVAFLWILPNLRCLDLSPNVTFSDDQSSLSDIPMLLLRNAYLDEAKLSAVEIGKMTLLPNIQSLEVLWFMDDPANELARLTRMSSLKSILVWCTLPLSGLRRLAALPRALEVFSCHVCAFGILSPRYMSLALAPTCFTLQSLTLLDDEEREIETDDSLMEFSCFSSLKYLEVLHLFCFPPDETSHPRQRRGFYRKLPPTLENFRASTQSSCPTSYPHHPSKCR